MDHSQYPYWKSNFYRVEIYLWTLDEMITSDEVIKELFEIADKKVPEQVVDRDEIRGELDELNEGRLLIKYVILYNSYNIIYILYDII